MYYGRPSFGMIPPAVKNILLGSLAVFLFQSLLAPNLNEMLLPFVPDAYEDFIRNGVLNSFDLVFGMVPALVIGKFYIWQFVTYIFLHGNFGHIFFNMFALWMFGSELERTWGTREFTRYFLLTGTLAGVSIFIWNFGSYSPTIGASGAVFGILVAYALFFPDNEIYLYFLFPIKAKYFVLIYGLIELMMLPNQDGISHIGHLGGMVAGFFYLRHRYRHWGIGRNLFRNPFKKKGPF